MEMNIEQIVAEMRQKIASRPAKNEDDFSESEYLELYPDVSQAVAAERFSSSTRNRLSMRSADRMPALGGRGGSIGRAINELVRASA